MGTDDVPQWRRWVEPPVTATRSSVSGVDDWPYEMLNATMPYFSLYNTQLYITPNGFISLTAAPACAQLPYTGGGDFSGLYCPLSSNVSFQTTKWYPNGAQPLIALWIEDLNPGGGTPESGIYFWTEENKYGDNTNVVIVTYRKIPVYNSTTEYITAQLELWPANGTIIMRYKDVYVPPATRQAPAVGLLWPPTQSQIVTTPRSGDVLRFDSTVDGCNVGVTTCGQCIAKAGCVWCASLQSCMQKNAVYASEYCLGVDLRTDDSVWKCGGPSTVHGFDYSISAEYDLDAAKAATTGTFKNWRTPTSSKVVVGTVLETFMNVLAGKGVQFFSNPPVKKANDSYKNIYVEAATGVVQLNAGNCVASATQCVRSDSFVRAVMPFAGDLDPALSRDVVAFETDDQEAFVVQWNGVSPNLLPATVPIRLHIQTEIFRNGSVVFTYYSGATPRALGFPFLSMAYPRVGLRFDVNRGYEFPWSLLRSGLRLQFSLLPGCPASCFRDKCNRDSQRCECQCTAGAGICADASESDGTCTSCKSLTMSGILCDVPCTCNTAQGMCSNGTCKVGLHPANTDISEGRCREANWAGESCTQCADGFFGSTCKPCNCDGQTSCKGNRADTSPKATCDICLKGWAGPSCGQCAPGYGGINCEKCDCNGGTCDAGKRCVACPTGFWGPKCANNCTCAKGTCNGGPQGNGLCSACESGWAGERCDKPCTCRVGGHENCNDGVNGTGTCLFCPSTTRYGKNCEPCICSADIGVCDGYMEGTGKCKACLAGRAGPACADNCTSCNPYHGLCFANSSSGCICNSGRDQKTNCETCLAGYYGPNCVRCVCKYGLCDDGVTGTGQCKACSPGYFGSLCDTWCQNTSCGSDEICAEGPNGGCARVQQESEKSAVSGIMVTVIVVILIVLCVCVVVAVAISFRTKRVPGHLSALVVERTPAGNREVIPVPRQRSGTAPVQGIPLQQLPLTLLREQNLARQRDGDNELQSLTSPQAMGYEEGVDGSTVGSTTTLVSRGRG